QPRGQDRPRRPWLPHPGHHRDPRRPAGRLGHEMPIGISDEHEALRATVRRWLDSHCDPSVPRGRLEADTDHDPAFWRAVASQGWLGLHVEESVGGQGYGLLELAVVLEEFGR